jgi:hypothetical protein
MEAEPMRVLQYAKRSVLTVAAVCSVLTGCGDSGPEVPFNPAGTTADLEAMNATFESPVFASFSTFSLMFDPALAGAPMISASAAAMDVRASTTADLRAVAVRSARRLAGLIRSPKHDGFSAAAAAIPAGVAGRTLVYDVATDRYVLSDRALLATNTVRFILYAVDPVTFAPVEPLVETGHVDLVQLSSTSTSASARVTVVSGTTTYLNYTVSVVSTASSGRVSVSGFITDGNNEANIDLRATLTLSGGLTLTYGVDVPTRDVSIDLTLTSSGVDPESSTIDIRLDMRGPNCWIVMTGEFTTTGGTLTVQNNGDAFATITTSGTEAPVITGAEGQPLTDEEVQALGAIFLLTNEAFASFDQLFAPVGIFVEPTA